MLWFYFSIEILTIPVNPPLMAFNTLRPVPKFLLSQLITKSKLKPAKEPEMGTVKDAAGST